MASLELRTDDSAELERLQERAQTLPIVAVREGYRYLHTKLHELTGQPVDPRRNLDAIANYAKRQGQLPATAMAAVDGMQVLWDLSERDSGSGLIITPELATEFLTYLRAVLASLRTNAVS